MPDPNKYDDKKEWMSDCMHTSIKEEGKPQGQAVAICLNMWRNKGKKGKRKNASDVLRCAAEALMASPLPTGDGPPHHYMVSKTYEVVTDESAEQGDFADHGFEFESKKYDSLRDLIEDNRNESWIEWSSSHVRGDEWLISEADQDQHTGEYRSYGLHIKRSDGKPLSRREVDAISQGLGVNKHPYIGVRREA